jgi:hypothetical protein
MRKFNIIITNKNKTETAPTYTININIAINSAPKKTKKINETPKAKIKAKIE